MSTIAPGLTLSRIVDSRGPNRIRVLEVDPARALTLDVALANNEIPGHERTTSMASRHGAIAAINGDYTIVPGATGAGRPINTFAEDGALVTSPLIWGRNFAISQDEQQTFVKHTGLAITLTEGDAGLKRRVTKWNDFRPEQGEVAGYTVAGGYGFRPPTHACSARLYPAGELRWRKSMLGLENDYVVHRVRCSEKRMMRRGGVVIATNRGTEEGAFLKGSLTPGETVRLGWSMGWPGVMDTIGGNPTLIEDGILTVQPCDTSYFCDRNPRTGVGTTADGHVLLVTVDGRQPGSSVGMKPVAFGRLFQYLDATWALNVDGGGSTTMVVKGNIVNRPSDLGGERAVGSALLVLPRTDAAEPVPAFYPGTTGVESTSFSEASFALAPAEVDAATLSLFDPASTGGMLDALARGDLGAGPGALDPVVTRAVESFRTQWRSGDVPDELNLGVE